MTKQENYKKGWCNMAMKLTQDTILTRARGAKIGKPYVITGVIPTNDGTRYILNGGDEILLSKKSTINSEYNMQRA